MARKTGTVTISDGTVVSIRQLGWEQLRASKRAAQQESARNLVAMGGAEFMKAWQAMKGDQPVVSDSTVAPVVAVPDILDGHDLATVLASGITKPTGEAFIADLTEADAETLGRAILDLSPKPRTEDEEKNVA